MSVYSVFFFQAEDGIRDLVRSRGLGDVYKRQVVTLLSIDYIKKYGAYFGEYYIILQTSVLGMMLMAAAKDLFVIFLGLEIMSVSFYILAGMNRKKAGANETLSLIHI